MEHVLSVSLDKTTELNDRPDSSGTWIYMLGLTLDGEAYSTLSTVPTGTTTHLSIRNN